MLARGILGSRRTGGVSFWPFLNSSGWWCLISFIFITRISCHKTTHANGYYGAWPGWAVSISVPPLQFHGGSRGCRHRWWKLGCLHSVVWARRREALCSQLNFFLFPDNLTPSSFPGFLILLPDALWRSVQVSRQDLLGDDCGGGHLGYPLSLKTPLQITWYLQVPQSF